MQEAEARKWYLIMITDDNEDVSPDLVTKYPDAHELAVGYRASVDERSQVAFTYRRDPHLIMEIFTVRPNNMPNQPPQPPVEEETPTPPVPPGPPITLTRPEDGEQIAQEEGSSMISFAWRASENEIKGFRLVIKDRAGKVVKSASSATRKVYTYQELLPSGTYTWYVEGRRKDGRSVKSAERRFHVSHDVDLSILGWIAAFLAGLGGLYWVAQVRRKKQWNKRFAQEPSAGGSV